MVSLRRTLVLTVALAVTAAMVLISPADAAPRFLDVIVVLDGEPGRADGRAAAEATARQHGVEASFVYEHALRGFAGRVPEGRLNGLRNDPRVAYVERDVQVQVATQDVPIGIERIFADVNPAIPTDGLGGAVDVDVAVFDTGIDGSHPDLHVVDAVDCTLTTGGNPWNRTSYCGAGGVDGNGHGTHVAGTIAARNNGSGVVGVAPGARLWSVKVLTDTGGGTVSGIVAGIDYVTKHADQLEVANMSISGPAPSQSLEDAIARSTAAGILYVVAAGNETEDVANWVPAGHPDALTVSALADYDGKPGGLAAPDCKDHGPDDSFATFSNYGDAVDIIAPGACIRSTWPGGGYATGSGTSMAAPHVAGAAALLASNGLDVATIRDTLVTTGNDGYDGSADPDGITEPLLDVSSFEPTLVGAVGDPGDGGDPGSGDPDEGGPDHGTPDDGAPGDDEGSGLVVSLAGAATSAKGSWTPSVTPTVTDDGLAVSGVLVEMTYRSSRGEIGAVSCTTGATGDCTATLPSLPNRDGSVTVNVETVSAGGLETLVSLTIVRS